MIKTVKVWDGHTLGITHTLGAIWVVCSCGQLSVNVEQERQAFTVHAQHLQEIYGGQ